MIHASCEPTVDAGILTLSGHTTTRTLVVMEGGRKAITRRLCESNFQLTIISSSRPSDQSTISSVSKYLALHSVMSNFEQSDMATPQPDPDDRLVDVFVRGGYPVDREVIFSFAVRLAEHYSIRKPFDCDDRGGIYNRINDFLDRYEDLDCTTVGNPADPTGTGYTWIIATTPFKRVQVRRSELDNLRKDPWRPPSAFEIQESHLDVDFRDYLAQNGVSLQPSHFYRQWSHHICRRPHTTFSYYFLE